MSVVSYFYQNNFLHYVDDQGEAHKFCRGIKVNNVAKDVVSKKEELEIEYFTRDFLPETITFPASELEGHWASLLAGRGFLIPGEEAGKILLKEILRRQYNKSSKVPTEYLHPSVGYLNVEGQRCFFGYEEASGLFPSRYSGQLHIQPNGSAEKWFEMLREALAENPKLILPIAMGASAPVAVRLGLEETFIWALIGVTTTGKTTSLRLSSSVWGEPNPKGLINNLIGTQNGLFAMLTERMGFPCFVDETSAAKWDFTKMLYAIALSLEGARCNPDGTLKPKKTWAGAVTFTGETSMFNQAAENGGLYARLIEFENKWFSSSSLPDMINDCVTENYGHGWKPYVQYLESLDDVTLKRQYKESIEEFTSAIVENKKDITSVEGLGLRIAKKIAALLFTVDLLTKAWEITIDRAAVIDTLVSVYEHNVSRIDKITLFFESLLQFFAQNRSRIIARSGMTSQAFPPSSCIGYEETNNGVRRIYLHATVLAEKLNEFGLGMSKAILKELEQRHILVRFGDRYLQRPGDFQEPCYCINTDPLKAVDFKTKIQKKKQPLKPEVTKPYAKSLLED